MSELVERTVLVDQYNWMTKGDDGKPFYNSAPRGATVLVSPEEAARGEQIFVKNGGPAALGDPQQLAALQQAEKAYIVQQWDDDRLRDATVPQLEEYVASRPDETQRVLDLENERPRPRKAILAFGDHLVPSE